MTRPVNRPAPPRDPNALAPQFSDFFTAIIRRRRCLAQRGLPGFQRRSSETTGRHFHSFEASLCPRPWFSMVNSKTHKSCKDQKAKPSQAVGCMRCMKVSEE
eukprot:scpid87327/ scgid15507/ 